MTKDDIIRMARKEGVDNSWDINWFDPYYACFAKLVAAAEREAIATEFMKRHEAVKHLNNYWHHAAVYVRARGNYEKLD